MSKDTLYLLSSLLIPRFPDQRDTIYFLSNIITTFSFFISQTWCFSFLPLLLILIFLSVFERSYNSYPLFCSKRNIWLSLYETHSGSFQTSSTRSTPVTIVRTQPADQNKTFQCWSVWNICHFKQTTTEERSDLSSTAESTNRRDYHYTNVNIYNNKAISGTSCPFSHAYGENISHAGDTETLVKTEELRRAHLHQSCPSCREEVTRLRPAERLWWTVPFLKHTDIRVRTELHVQRRTRVSITQ